MSSPYSSQKDFLRWQGQDIHERYGEPAYLQEPHQPVQESYGEATFQVGQDHALYSGWQLDPNIHSVDTPLSVNNVAVALSSIPRPGNPYLTTWSDSNWTPGNDDAHVPASTYQQTITSGLGQVEQATWAALEQEYRDLCGAGMPGTDSTPSHSDMSGSSVSIHRVPGEIGNSSTQFTDGAGKNCYPNTTRTSVQTSAFSFETPNASRPLGSGSTFDTYASDPMDNRQGPVGSGSLAGSREGDSFVPYGYAAALQASHFRKILPRSTISEVPGERDSIGKSELGQAKTGYRQRDRKDWSELDECVDRRNDGEQKMRWKDAEACMSTFYTMKRTAIISILSRRFHHTPASCEERTISRIPIDPNGKRSGYLQMNHFNPDWQELKTHIDTVWNNGSTVRHKALLEYAETNLPELDCTSLSIALDMRYVWSTQEGEDDKVMVSSPCEQRNQHEK